MENLRLSSGVGIVPAQYAVLDGTGELVLARIFDRSKTRVASAATSIMNGGSGSFLYDEEAYGRPCSRSINFYRRRDSSMNVTYKPVVFGRDRAVVCTMVSDTLGETHILTTQELIYQDLYCFLMKKFTLPLLPDWMPYVYEQLKAGRFIGFTSRIYHAEGEAGDYLIPLGDKEVALDKVVCLTCFFGEQELTEILSEGLKCGRLRIAEEDQLPLDLSGGMDGYMTTYGKSVRENVDKCITPLVPLKDKVDEFVSKKTRPYPQQAAVINGMIALYENKSKYGLLNCGMGCGKTLMAIGSVEGAMNRKWLRNHPGKTLKDMYLEKEDKVSYRAIVMPPGHLVEKWKREILREVPGAKAEIISDLSQLVKIREAGKKADGREWYIIGKDFAKMGGTTSPTPSTVKRGIPMMLHCKDCYETDGVISDKVYNPDGKSTCPRCGGHHMVYREMNELSLQSSLLCPDCGKPLLTKKAFGINDRDDEDVKTTLTPADFNNRKDSNSKCLLCGANLWGINVKPNDGKIKKPRWYKVSHFSNYARKARTTSWVLRGYETEYFSRYGMLGQEYKNVKNPLEKADPLFDVKEGAFIYSPRKVSPASYIKNYLKGYFDFCILDEVHKYAGAGTAQSCAAHALVKASKFTMGLTGTLTNGKADSLFYLLWMLDPAKMVKKGFTYDSALAFSQQYGCVETRYSYEGGDNLHNASSRGRQLGKPSTKPGISPMIYADFLLGKALNMDLSDMTKYMPPLKESVELCKLPADVLWSYNGVAEILKDAAKEKDGGGLLGKALQFCLSYPDKPYGVLPIMHPRLKNYTVCKVPGYEEYSEIGNLLDKERRITEIVNREMSEGRNVFIFANFTGKGETNVTERVKQVVEHYCNLKGRVEILKAESPEAVKREAYIHARAKAGVKVVITNAKVCETGLDFCFEENGIFYNYPTIIFMQPIYELAVMMQASRRHYRLNQTEECRTYWMAYEGTLQAAALQIMASKQVAASAIQGKFSAEGLASMAQGVDPRVLLMQKLSQGDNSSREELSSMFDVLAKNNAEDRDGADTEYIPPQTYFELMGESYEESSECISEEELFSSIISFEDFVEQAKEPAVHVNVQKSMKKSKTGKTACDPFASSVVAFEVQEAFVNKAVDELWKNYKPKRRQKAVAFMETAVSFF